MTYLEILKKAARKAGIAMPTTTVGQTGETGRLVDFIAEAYRDIQTYRSNWSFMWARGEIETTADTKDYDPTSTVLGHIDPESWTIFKTADGESTEAGLQYIGYKTFRQDFATGTVTADYPSIATVLPNKYIRLYPTPNDAYKVQFDYYRIPDVLSGDADVPIMPTPYQDLIVYGAIMKYGAYEETEKLIVMYEGQYSRLMQDMLWQELDEDELPQVIAV